MAVIKLAVGSDRHHESPAPIQKKRNILGERKYNVVAKKIRIKMRAMGDSLTSMIAVACEMS